MQRLVNEKDHVVEDMLEGYVQAKSYIEYGGSEKRVVKYTDIPQGKVGLVSGGEAGMSRHSLAISVRICWML